MDLTSINTIIITEATGLLLSALLLLLLGKSKLPGLLMR
jgi:hypothetical protein